MKISEKADIRDKIKSEKDISILAGQLNHKNQSYILNTIDTLLFAQQTAERSSENKRAGLY